MKIRRLSIFACSVVLSFSCGDGKVSDSGKIETSPVATSAQSTVVRSAPTPESEKISAWIAAGRKVIVERKRTGNWFYARAIGKRDGIGGFEIQVDVVLANESSPEWVPVGDIRLIDERSMNKIVMLVDTFIANDIRPETYGFSCKLDSLTFDGKKVETEGQMQELFGAPDRENEGYAVYETDFDIPSIFELSVKYDSGRIIELKFEEVYIPI